MAKQVEDIVVRLVGEGFEALDKIKGSFRELGKVTNLAEKDILSARDSLLEYARRAGNTEAVNKGLNDAFKGLRSQVDMCSDAYRVLSSDLRKLDEVSRGATESVMAQRQAVLSSAAASTQNAAALRQQRAALIALRAQTRESSEAFNQFSADIQRVETRLANLADVNNKLNRALSRARSGTSAGARAELADINNGIAALRQEIDAIDLLNSKTRASAATQRERLEIETRLNSALAARRQLQFQETARTARETVRTAATTFNSTDLTTGYLSAQRISGRLGDLPNTTAGLNQELAELNERLVNTYRNTDAYLQVAMQMAGVQRELTSVTRGYAQSLVMGLKTNTVEPSARNLQEAITALRAEMAQLDTTTSEGSRAYADNAHEANALDRRLRNLADAYREVGSMATVAATAEQNAANARIRGNYLNRSAVRQQEQALRDLGEQVRQGIAGTPLLLPAAGQTTAAGTGQLISGGARRLRGQVETTFGAGVDAAGNTPRAPWQQNYLPNAAVGTAPAVGFAAGAAQAFDNLGRSTDRARRPLRDIFAELERVRGASNGSVNSLQAQISAWTQIRSAVSSSAPVFATATKQIEALSRQQARLQVGGQRRLTGSQLAQGAGAAISGGIFGGPEGLIGGLGGLAVGGVGGAFAGAAAGAQVGMFRQQLGGTADYAASIGKLQIALRGVVGSQQAYDQAIRAAAAATRDLNIPQEEATRGLTRLSAAVIGAGGTVADSSFAFRAMSEAIKATGGNAEQVDGALLALTQVFSKGKVSAEELNQIAERLPGTFTLFAKATGKTGPELQKALEQGQVGLNDLMKFLELTGKRYGTTALEIAGSSQDAGARLTVAFQAMRLEVGKALQPLGAELQGAFATFIKDITPAVVGSAKAIAEVLKFFVTNETAGGLAKFAFQLGAVALAIKGLQAASAGLTALNIAGWFTSAAASAKITGDVMAGAATKTSSFNVAANNLLSGLSKLAALGVVTVGVTYIERRIKEATGIQTLAEREAAGGAARQFQGATREVVVAAQNAQKKEAYRQQQRETKLQKDIAKNSLLYQLPVISAILAQTFTEQQTRLGYEQRFTKGVLGLDPSKFPTEASTKTNFPGTTGEDSAAAAAAKAKRDRETAAAEQQRQNEAIAKAKIALDDAVFRNGMELIRKKYEYEQELENKKRDLFVKSQTGAARETAGLISGFLGELQTLTNRLQAAGEGVESATQELKSAKQMAATTVGSAQTAQGYISKEQLRAYLISQGMGRTSGDFTNAGHKTPNHMLNAMDMGFTSAKYDSNYVAKTIEMERKLRATGAFGSQLFGPERDPRGHKDHLHIPTEGGRVPLTPGLASLMGIGAAGAGRQPTGVAAAARRDITAESGAAIAEANLDKAKTAQLLEAKTVKELTALAGKSFVLDFTDALRQQNAALQDTAAITDLRNRLQLAGERPETIDAEVRKAEAIQRSTQQTDLAAKALKALDDAGLGGSVAATSLRDGIAAQNAEIAKFKELTDAATAAQIQFNEAMRTRQDTRIGLGIQEGATSYIESIGTMRDATAQLTQVGIKGLEDQIFSLATTGKANFRDFAADILKQTTRMIIQQMILRVIMQAIGAIGGGGGGLSNLSAPATINNPLGVLNANGNAFAKNGIVPYAMGGVVGTPTLFKFANGGAMRTGIMGEAGPEAIIPLKRGRDGKLGVSGGSGTAPVTVNVSVDASGSQVQGNSGQGEALGRAIAQAVQAELIKQKRSGGLLAS